MRSTLISLLVVGLGLFLVGGCASSAPVVFSLVAPPPTGSTGLLRSDGRFVIARGAVAMRTMAAVRVVQQDGSFAWAPLWVQDVEEDALYWADFQESRDFHRIEEEEPVPAELRALFLSDEEAETLGVRFAAGE